MFNQQGQTALQGAAADDVGQSGMQVVDPDALGMPANLGFYPRSQILREFFWHALPIYWRDIDIRAITLDLLARIVNLRVIYWRAWHDSRQKPACIERFHPFIDSVHRYKGQSAPCILFTEIDFEQLDEISWKLFVGMTRATMKLVMVVSKRAAGAMMKHLE